jgi:hypothetical protein
VEYAQKAVENSGLVVDLFLVTVYNLVICRTAVGIKCSDGIVIAVGKVRHAVQHIKLC